MGRQLILWLILGSLTGALVGVVVTYFLKLLFWSIAVTHPWPFYAIALALPAGGLLTGLLIHYGAPTAAGHGTEAVIRAVHQQSGRINWKVAPIKALATITTIAPGGSAGKEGPSAQIGAAVASALADLFRFSADQRKRIVICGIGAGFAAVFGTPVAGAILGIEVLAMGELWYEMLLPSFAASVMSYTVSRALGLTWFYPRTHLSISLNLWVFGKLLALGIACGLAAYLLVLLMDRLHHTTHYLTQVRHWWTPWFPFLASILLVVLYYITSRQYGGLSLGLLTQSLAGHPVPTMAWAFKLLAVGITLGLGMSGGIITPLFVIGATLGTTLAGPLHLPLAIGAELGMVGVTAAGANAPIALIIMGMELFGARLAPEYLIVAVPAFIMIGNHSVYPSQQVHVQKSPWVPIILGRALEDTPETPLPFPWIKRSSRPAKKKSKDAL